MPYLTVNNKRLFYAFKPGRKALPQVIFIHGAGSNHLGWPPELRCMPDYSVYLLDLPGHGRSDPPAYANITHYCDDVANFISTLNLQNVVIIGHSMGGAIAQMVALRHPNKAAGIILIGTGARPLVSDTILDQTLIDFEATLKFVNKYAWARNTAAHLIEGSHKLMLTTGKKVTHGDYVACNLFNVREMLPQIHQPTLVIAGTVDMMTPHKFGVFLADHIPNSELVTIEGGGHMMMLEQPKTVATAVITFLQDQFKSD